MPTLTKKPSRKQAAPDRPVLELMNTGVPQLDDVLGGGLPEFSFNLVAGGPGSGKTTLTMQILFANATAERPALYFTLLGETGLKMLRYQQQFDFFDPSRVGRDVHFLNLSEEALTGDLESLLTRITGEINRLNPAIVVVDSFRSLMRSQGMNAPDRELEHFVQHLAVQLTTWEVTSFLIGEYSEQELRDPVFTVADGIFWLSQATNRNSVVRRLQVVKARGMASMPGLHTMRITQAGVQVFPRTPERANDVPLRTGRLSTGIAGLDEMMGGGIPAGDSLVLAGPTGTGKTTFAMKFIAAGLAAGETAVIAIFEEHPEIYLQRAKSVDVDLRQAVKDNKLRIIYLRPLDLSVDETLDEIRTAVRQLGAKRVVIDSISGFEMALAPAFRDDFRESLYRLIGALTGLGVTMYSTVEVVEGGDGSSGLQLTGYKVSFLTDDILSQRYIEMEGELKKALVVVKMRGSSHSREFRTYEITTTGVQLRESLREYDSIITGMPKRQLRIPPPLYPGLTEQEVLVLEMVVRAGGMSSAEVAKQTGLPARAVEVILDRMVHLQFVSRKGTRYEAEARRRGL